MAAQEAAYGAEPPAPGARTRPPYADSSAPGIVEGPGGARALSVLAPLGRLTVAQWRLLTAIAAEDGAGALRLTPWRGIVLPGLAAAAAPDRLARLAAAGLVTDPASPGTASAPAPAAPAAPSPHRRTRRRHGRRRRRHGRPGRGTRRPPARGPARVLVRLRTPLRAPARHLGRRTGHGRGLPDGPGGPGHRAAHRTRPDGPAPGPMNHPVHRTGPNRPQAPCTTS
ncbi:hypothetical protein [Streptomyces angustmyceticus]|uniref:hypothetical protein n=1 Tax=Streptomyces angustmyceticus TaxID=285578 RepID=UPI0021AE4853|nr:hypothetical protein [Streptomyces angustmyceticus]